MKLRDPGDWAMGFGMGLIIGALVALVRKLGLS